MSEMQNSMPDASAEKTEAVREGTSISHNFKYFRDSVLGDKKENFSLPGDAAYQKQMLELGHDLIVNHLAMYVETVSEDYPGYTDFDFLKKYIERIYDILRLKPELQSQYPLTRAFETPEVQDRFFALMEKYLFEDFGRKHLELTEQFRRPLPEPAKKPPILTDEEIDGLVGTFDESGKRIK